MKLPKKVTIRDARTLASAILQALSANALRIDASDVENIDTSGLQLLCAVKKAAPASFIDRPSAAFIDIAQRCGVGHLLLHDLQGVA